MEKFDAMGEWRGMPEFIQEKKEPYSKIIVRFDNEEALQNFANLIGQKLNKKTKSIWHPYKSHFGNGEKFVYQDEFNDKSLDEN